MKQLQILAVILKYDYGKKELGTSFEYNTFYTFFVSQGHKVDIFDYGTIFQKKGAVALEKSLRRMLQTHSYDLIFSVPFTHQLRNSTLDSIKKENSGVPSVAWMCDDKWRFEEYSNQLAHHFDYMITTDPDALEKYQEIGYSNVILSQWGFDPKIYKKIKTTKKFDVTFIGGASPWREFVVARLRKKNISVHCFGAGWENGRISVDEMITIYNQSKIVLNLSNSTQFYVPFLSWIRPFTRKKTWKESIFNSFPGILEFIISKKRKEDIKARFFEVTGCGAFLLSYSVEHLDKYLTPEKDFSIYKNLDELECKIIYFLSHESEREKIALNGYKKAQKFHTYIARFKKIFSKIGIS